MTAEEPKVKKSAIAIEQSDDKPNHKIMIGVSQMTIIEMNALKERGESDKIPIDEYIVGCTHGEGFKIVIRTPDKDAAYQCYNQLDLHKETIDKDIPVTIPPPPSVDTEKINSFALLFYMNPDTKDRKALVVETALPIDEVQKLVEEGKDIPRERFAIHWIKAGVQNRVDIMSTIKDAEDFFNSIEV